MKLACLFGHCWEGCVCRRCGAKAHERSGRHKWEYLGTVKMECSFSSSRGSGQHLDPCYGVDCQFCDAYNRMEYTYTCQTCGMTIVSLEPYSQERKHE